MIREVYTVSKEMPVLPGESFSGLTGSALRLIQAAGCQFDFRLFYNDDAPDE